MDLRDSTTGNNYNIFSFIRQEAFGGFLLIAVTILAMIWANSAFYDTYHYLFHDVNLGWSAAGFSLEKSLHHWINDGLMAIFFFMVGLEIKREVIAGELSTLKKAALPIGAAIGGMLVPATIYAALHFNNPETIHGWGVPMATDIAFALGLLSLLGKRVPISLKIFLTALAIADDLGAILVIAIFYTESINLTGLLTSIGFLTVLLAANRMGVRRTSFYAIVGFLGVWLAFLFSGVHATIAGVLIALTIPGRTKITEKKYIEDVVVLVDRFRNEQPNDNSLLTQQQSHLVSKIGKLSDDANTPLQKLEHMLHPITAFFILPIFALANAGVHIQGNLFDMVLHPVSLGIIAGLVLGKFIGISLFSRLMVALKIALLPEGVSWKQIYGAGMMAGIGFTMSIFISGLAFASDDLQQIAKVGIFTASFISAILSLMWLSWAGRK
jgi:NhaA family Na+:H+ antiporter